MNTLLNLDNTEKKTFRTTFEDGIFTIEGYGGGYEIYFELTIEGDILSGSLMGMFDVSGMRVKD